MHLSETPEGRNQKQFKTLDSALMENLAISRPRMEEQRYKVKTIKPSQTGWDDRWNITESKNNSHCINFNREFFDKPCKVKATHFQFSYAGYSPDSLPGIIDTKTK